MSRLVSVQENKKDIHFSQGCFPWASVVLAQALKEDIERRSSLGSCGLAAEFTSTAG
jgi:hypothetical protein